MSLSPRVAIGSELLDLAPAPSLDAQCPYCIGRPLVARDFHIPGVFVLIDAQCDQCQRRYFVRPPIGFGGGRWIVAEAANGQIHSSQLGDWPEDAVKKSVTRHGQFPAQLTVIRRAPVLRPLLVNCIDVFFGHCLHKLYCVHRLMRQYPHLQLVVLINANAAWLVPDGVAEIWATDLPLNQSEPWNEPLNQAIKHQLKRFAYTLLAGSIETATQPIETFSRVRPFDFMAATALNEPRMAIIWREDRIWDSGDGVPAAEPIAGQIQRFAQFAEAARRRIPELRVAAYGFGRTGTLPAWIEDNRLSPGQRPDEQAWCRAYASCHVVVGVHGSNMLLPASHAGGFIEVVPPHKWSNVGDTLDFIATGDGAPLLRRGRHLPYSIPPVELATVALTLLRNVRAEALYRQNRAAAARGDIAEQRRLIDNFSAATRYVHPCQ